VGRGGCLRTEGSYRNLRKAKRVRKGKRRSLHATRTDSQKIRTKGAVMLMGEKGCKGFAGESGKVDTRKENV